jgi:predicted porin
MQKKLLTVAVAGALAAPGLALAQSSVEVYGTVNMSVNLVRYSASAAGAPSIGKWDVASHASNYGLRGRESLGGGLSAWFQIEQNAPIERSNNAAITPASRNSAVGFQGSWGNLFIGQWTTPWADLESLWSIGTVGGWGPTTSIIGRRETTGTAPNANCTNGGTGGGGATAVGAGAAGAAATLSLSCDALEAGGGVGHPFWRRISQSIFYQSPVWNGLQAKFAWQTNEGKSNVSSAAGSTDPNMWSMSLAYTGMGGRLRIGGAYDRHEDHTTANTADTGWKLVGGYNFGPVDVGLVYERMNYKTAGGNCRARQWGLAAAIPVGQGAIRGSFAKAADLAGPAVGCAGDNGAREFNIGYEYRFSKRTSIGVGYAQIRNDTAGVFTWTGMPPNQAGASNTPLAGSDPSAITFNVTHRF